jgi:hypothetical protein
MAASEKDSKCPKSIELNTPDADWKILTEESRVLPVVY